MSDSWPSTAHYLTVPAGINNPRDPAVTVHPTLKAAQSQIAYWERYVPGAEHQLVLAVTTYTVVETAMAMELADRSR